MLDVKPVEAGCHGRLAPRQVAAFSLALAPFLGHRTKLAATLRHVAFGVTLLTALRSVAEFAKRRSMQRDLGKGGRADSARFRVCRCHGQVSLFPPSGRSSGTGRRTDRNAGNGRQPGGSDPGTPSAAQGPIAYGPGVSRPSSFVAAIGVAMFMIVSVIPKLEVFLKALGRKLPAPRPSFCSTSPKPCRFMPRGSSAA